ncbi:MAG: hypothetical protein ABIJ45_01590 [Candidatus Zixiibacteriota bacterium]
MIFAKLKTLALALILIFVAACDESVTNSGDNEIMPLDFNNEWFGSLVTYSFDGTIIDSADFNYRIFDSIIINGAKWFGLEYIFDNTDTTDSKILLQAGSGGLWSRRNCAPSTCPAYFYAKYPAIKNDTFYTADTVYSFARVVSVDTAITVPAGTFTCNAYIWYINNFFEDYKIYYLAPNIGYVKIETYGIDPVDAPYVEQVWYLEHYRVK